MALRQRGKQGFWCAYFRSERQTEKGIRKIMVTVPLGTTDKLEARALESELMRKNRQTIQRARVQRILNGSENPNGSEILNSSPYREHRKRRLLISDALEAAEKHRELGETTKKLWRKFAHSLKLKYMDEITQDIVFDYLEKNYNRKNGKSYNNNKSALNNVFRLTLIESGLEDSPLAKIPQRRVFSEHQRPFMEEEAVRLYRAADQPWKSAVMIAWHTGFRQNDVFLLKWAELDIIPGFIVHTPNKTARFGRAVCIPIHKQLADELASIPRVNERVLGAWYYGSSAKFRTAFSELLDRCGIKDNEEGTVCFDSFRNSFITRCDENDVPRHATRGMAGHKTDRMTDLYSHDLQSARKIQELPGLNLDKPEQTE